MPDGRIEAEARVIEALPNALYRVELLSGSHPSLLAHLAAPGLLRVMAGDRVRVELSTFDPTRGRIVGRAGDVLPEGGRVGVR